MQSVFMCADVCLLQRIAPKVVLPFTCLRINITYNMHSQHSLVMVNLLLLLL